MIILQDGMVSQFLISIALFTSASEGKKKVDNKISGS